MVIAAWSGLLVGIAWGYASQRGAFCMSSGLRFLVTKRDPTKVKAYLLAVAVQMIIVPALFATGVARPAVPPLYPAGAIIGGLLFGISMQFAGGCAAGVWYKAGSGMTTALASLVGMAAGIVMLDVGPLRSLRASLQGPGSTWTMAGGAGIPLDAVAVPLGIVLAAALLRTRVTVAGAWTWRRTGLVVGLLAAAAWPLSALVGRDFGLAVMPGTGALATSMSRLTLMRWDVLLLLGLPIGAFVAARLSGPVLFERVTVRLAIERFAGGVGLGAGASLAAGCTVGHGLTGVPVLAPGSFLAMASIAAGAIGSAAWASRRPRSASIRVG